LPLRAVGLFPQREAYVSQTITEWSTQRILCGQDVAGRKQPLTCRYRSAAGGFFRPGMDNPIRIVVANCHPIIRSDLRLLLEREPKFRVVGEAANGREAVLLAEFRHPDIVLLDVKLQQLNGMGAAREIASAKPELGIIFVSALSDREYVSEAFKAGARGYVLDDAVQSDLIPAIHVVAGGGRFLSPAISARLIDEFGTNDPSEYVSWLTSSQSH